ncbi:MAG: long-chain-fatty-acid--CoA ligase [Rhodospirillales bacterium]|jgi:acyl-CoA synthetase (AMP-forming)/AMP-acid ligase II|nr:long-chain-fatty-acid--CoA ligase [Rhodospirillales bacterium]
MIVSDIVLRQAVQCPDKVALVWDGQPMTFAELKSRVLRFANALSALGIAKGDRVALLSTNRREHVEVVFALSVVGAVWVPLNYRLTAREIEVQVSNVECSAFIYGDDMADKAEELRDRDTSIRQWIGIGAKAAIGHRYEDLMAKSSDSLPQIRVEPDDLITIMHTGGTTGLPKGVMTTHRQLVLGALYWSYGSGARSDDKMLQVLPMMASGGNIMQLAQLMVGSTIHIAPRFDPEQVLRLIESERITYLPVVPSMIIFLLESPELTKHDLSSLKRIEYGSSPIPVDRLMRAGEVFDVDFQQTYGQTETSVLTNYLDGDDHRKGFSGEAPHLLESCGRCLLGYSGQVVDDDGNPVQRGEIGEYILRGESMMSGYWNLREVSERTLRGGWLHTGDAAKMDEEGYVYIVDRKVDKIISGGENVYPVEVENILSAHPGVLEAAVIGIPDERWVEAVKAIVVARPGLDLKAQDIIGFCRDKLAGFKIPKSVDFMDALPRTAYGKVRRSLLREPYWKSRERKIG